MTPRHEDKKEPPSGHGNEQNESQMDVVSEVSEEDLQLAEDDLEGEIVIRGNCGQVANSFSFQKSLP